MMGVLSPAETMEQCVRWGMGKAQRAGRTQFLLGILAGGIIALGCAASNTAVYGMEHAWTARTVSSLLFPFGLAMVVLLGGELFTGNCLLSVAVADRQVSLCQMVKNWSLVYCGNLAGAVFVAAGCAFFGQLDWSQGALAVYTLQVGASKCAISFGKGLVMGVLCNILVCLGVVMAMTAKDSTGKILGAFLPVCYFVLCGFEHCVANMYYIAAALFAKQVPAYAQLAAQSGLDLSALNMAGLLFNLVPVTLGNLVGGVGIGLLLWCCHGKRSVVPV